MSTRLLSIPAAAEQLDCSRSHVYGLVAAGHLRAVETKASGTRSKTRVRRDDVDDFIERQTRR